MKLNIDVAVYVVDIDGESKLIHAVNMKPGVRADRALGRSQTPFGVGIQFREKMVKRR